MHELLISPEDGNKMYACVLKQGRNLILHNVQLIIAEYCTCTCKLMQIANGIYYSACI